MSLCLIIVDGKRAGAQITLEPPGGCVGRAVDAAVFLPENAVSRQHAELRWNGRTWLVRNTSGSSPTVVDGAAIGLDEVPLQQAGQLRLGTVSLQYTQQAQVVLQPSAAQTVLRSTQISPPSEAVMRQLEPLQSSLFTPMIDDSPETLELEPVDLIELQSTSPPTLVRRPVAMPSIGHRDAPPTLISRPSAAVSSLTFPVDDAPPTLLLRGARAAGADFGYAAAPGPHQSSAVMPSQVRSEPPYQAAPPTLIRAQAPQPAASQLEVSPPTMIRRPKPSVLPPSPQVQAEAAPLVSRGYSIEPAVPSADSLQELPLDRMAKLERCNEALSRERDALREEVVQLKQRLQQLEETAAASVALQAHPPERAAVVDPAEADSAARSRKEALTLTSGLGELLEQASRALQDGESQSARGLIRDASFALADFRDLVLHSSS